MDYVQGNTTGNTEVDSKSPDGKEKLPIKRSKGSLGSLNMITGKKNEQNKAAANGGYPKRYSDRIMKLLLCVYPIEFFFTFVPFDVLND